MEEEAPQKVAPGKRIMGWVGTASALIGFGASIVGGVRWLENRHQDQALFASQMAVAEGQARQGEYQAAVRTYDGILKDNPLDPAALDAQLKTAMDWAENFSVSVDEGASATSAAAPQLDAMMAVLDSGLARSKGTAAADVQAHLGWAHWLNQHIAEREFGSAAEQDFHAALQLDPTNVYANAMLGNWMLQTHANFAEAIRHLQAAAATGKARPFVRSLQLGGLVYNETPGARAELFRTANAMRGNGEPLDEDQKHRIVSFCCNPSMTGHAELLQALSAVPKDDASKTYLWLDDAPQADPTDPTQRWNREFIEASLAEISGNRSEALKQFRSLQQELAKQPRTLKALVDEAIKRLSGS